MASSTKRVLVPITWPIGKVGRGHLLPDLGQHARSGFIRVPGGRAVTHGMVAFVRSSVTAEDMLEKWQTSLGQIAERQQALDLLEGYVRWLSTQQLGSVFEAAYDSNGVLGARKLASSPPTAKIPIPE